MTTPTRCAIADRRSSDIAQNHTEALYHLALMRAHGRGSAPDPTVAAIFAQRVCLRACERAHGIDAIIAQAADLGHASSQFVLGTMYLNGQGVPVDYERALHWFSLVRRAGCSWPSRTYLRKPQAVDSSDADLAQRARRAKAELEAALHAARERIDKVKQQYATPKWRQKYRLAAQAEASAAAQQAAVPDAASRGASITAAATAVAAGRAEGAATEEVEAAAGAAAEAGSAEAAAGGATQEARAVGLSDTASAHATSTGVVGAVDAAAGAGARQAADCEVDGQCQALHESNK